MKLHSMGGFRQVGKDRFRFEVEVGSGKPQKLVDVLNGLKAGKHFDIDIKPVRKHRSASANAYFWQLAQKIAEKVDSTKEEVYRNYIYHYGWFNTVWVIKAAADSFIKEWEENGLGWMCEKAEETSDHVVIFCFPGSSTYDTKRMSRLINAIVEDCKALGIETLTPEELAGLDYAAGRK